MGVSNRPVLVYSGGIAGWQRIEDIMGLFLHLKQRIEDLFMLFLTHEPFVLKGMIGNRARPDDVLVIQAPHREVSGYLCAADVGVLMREDRLTNHVAAPIKFSEYMCSGLPCIVSDRVGDTAEVIRRGNAGIVLDSQNRFPTLSEFQGLLSLNREEISKSMKEKYSSEVYLPQLLKLYEGLNAG